MGARSALMATLSPVWLALAVALCSCEQADSGSAVPKQGAAAVTATPLLAVGADAPDLTAVAHTGERVSGRHPGLHHRSAGARRAVQ
jgi:hypothetical protein